MTKISFETDDPNVLFQVTQLLTTLGTEYDEEVKKSGKGTA